MIIRTHDLCICMYDVQCAYAAIDKESEETAREAVESRELARDSIMSFVSCDWADTRIGSQGVHMLCNCLRYHDRDTGCDVLLHDTSFRKQLCL